MATSFVPTRQGGVTVSPSFQPDNPHRPDAADNPASFRQQVRAGEYPFPTNGVAPGYVQCNLLILPSDFANEFAEFCDRNSEACPVLARSEPGEPGLSSLGQDIDLRTDLGSYRIFSNGKPAGDVPDIIQEWRNDFVAFAFGCSFSFEEALLREGVELHYRNRGDCEALFLSNLDTNPTERFRGKIAVSMRPLTPENAEKAVAVTAKYPGVHGAPVHVGSPENIGVDLANPLDVIGRTRVMDNETPVFWACGVTPQLALAESGVPICITHTSAHMLVTDIQLEDLVAH
jgi:uncharacterized protein YcsI (UPF0317 family)